MCLGPIAASRVAYRRRVQERLANVALGLAVIAFVAVPLSYSWALNPESAPAWLSPFVGIAEFGGLACAIVAALVGARARAAGLRTPAAVWAPRIALASILAYVLTWTSLLTLNQP
jgi:hypothetical protein